MQQLLNFIGKRKHFFIFLLLQFIALWFTIASQDYHRSKFISSSNNITGSIYSINNSISDYFNLRIENQRLLEENAKLRSMLLSSMLNSSNTFSDKLDSVHNKYDQKFSFSHANVINNSYTMRNNNLTIDKGRINGVVEESGVITNNGVIGVIESVGRNYSSVISILNSKISINAKIKGSEYFGSLSWTGESRFDFILSDIPKQAVFEIGDTIVTGGYSSIFPENINLGKITEKTLPQNSNYYQIKVEPFIDYANVKGVYLVKNFHKAELKTLQNNSK